MLLLLLMHLLQHLRRHHRNLDRDVPRPAADAHRGGRRCGTAGRQCRPRPHRWSPRWTGRRRRGRRRRRAAGDEALLEARSGAAGGRPGGVDLPRRRRRRAPRGHLAELQLWRSGWKVSLAPLRHWRHARPVAHLRAREGNRTRHAWPPPWRFPGDRRRRPREARGGQARPRGNHRLLHEVSGPGRRRGANACGHHRGRHRSARARRSLPEEALLEHNARA
mmetsp:Transcript_88682/g.224065  ORF Transcript_88682/g.224065 Transcript_88682/m.224065 type:complete len:221 (+) Transcript_88682:156-818(+)